VQFEMNLNGLIGNVFLPYFFQKDKWAKSGNLLINWWSFSSPPPLGWGLSLRLCFLSS